ncbi:MAG: hypothetical protein JWN01_350 [Patescibacteria group bacterium]|nr:hypothetical protein [Patescibacteria group bacterium]
MALSEYRTTFSWQQAIELGPQLVRLAEELPGSEQLGLCWQLQQVMVELPTAIALDLLDDSYTRRPVALRLVATLEIIEKVYPALDTQALRGDAQDLIDRIGSDRFAEQTADARPEPAAVAAPAPAPVVSLPAEPQPAPASVAVTPEYAAAPAPVEQTAPTSVPVQAEVQPSTPEANV